MLIPVKKILISEAVLKIICNPKIMILGSCIRGKLVDFIGIHPFLEPRSPP